MAVAADIARPFDEFTEAQAAWPRGERPAAIRAAATEFRRRFKAQGEVRAVRTIDLVAAPYPVRFALAGAARSLNPLISIVNRMVIVQFEDFSGAPRTLVWEPTVPEGSAQAPFFEQLARRAGERLAQLAAPEYHTVGEALALCGLAPADVDYVSFDHLHVQDLRILMGTAEAVGTDNEPRAGFFPNARFLFQRAELDTLRSVHPLQWAWYVPGGMDGVDESRFELLDGDVELGIGVALAATPGHTDGNQSLVLNTPDGIWVSSENGVCADNWHPQLSKIPGVRKYAEFWNREVVMNSNTLEDSLDQYDSMLKEKALADANREDPRWRNVLPSSELATFKRQWPVLPTFVYGGINHGRIERLPAAGSGSNGAQPS
jgi:hypothetical protein